MSEAIDKIYVEARHIVLKNPSAKFVILSVPAYRHLRSNFEYGKYFWVNSQAQLIFMGKQVAIVEDHEIIIDVGGF